MVKSAFEKPYSTKSLMAGHEDYCGKVKEIQMKEYKKIQMNVLKVYLF